MGDLAKGGQVSPAKPYGGDSIPAVLSGGCCFPVSKSRMTPNQVKFLTALTDGSHKQAKGMLRRGKKFCCLGVACDVIRPDGSKWTPERHVNAEGDFVLPNKKGRMYRFEDGEGQFGSTMDLPVMVSHALGLDGDQNPLLIQVQCKDFPMTLSASELNDDHKLSFAQIAYLFKVLFETGKPLELPENAVPKDVVSELTLEDIPLLVSAE